MLSILVCCLIIIILKSVGTSYGNPNVTKLSKFKLKGVKVQSLYMEGCKKSMLQTQGCKSTALHVERCKRSNLQTCKLKGAKAVDVNSGMDWWNTAILKFCRIHDLCTFAPLRLHF